MTKKTPRDRHLESNQSAMSLLRHEDEERELDHTQAVTMCKHSGT